MNNYFVFVRDNTFDPRIICGLIALFIVNPLIGFLFISFIAMTYNHNKKIGEFWAIIAIIFICLLQWNRNIAWGQSTDWLNDGYLGIYLDAVRLDTRRFFLESAKEPLWRLMAFVGNPLTGGEYSIYVRLQAIFTLTMFGVALYRYWRWSGECNVVLIAMMGMGCFFLEFFGQLQTMLRMWMALSMVTVAQVQYISEGKRNWWLLCSAPLIHTFSAIYIMLMFVKVLYTKMDLKGFCYLLAIAGLISYAIGHIGFLQSIFGGIGAISYGLERVANAGADNVMDQNFLDTTTVRTTAIILISLSMLYIYRFNRNNKLSLFFVNHLVIMMAVSFVLIESVPEVTGRYYTSRMFIFPFIFPLLFSHYRWQYPANIFIIAFFFFRFFAGFDNIRSGENFFPAMIDMLPWTLFHYLF